jgi:hypothetical protein
VYVDNVVIAAFGGTPTAGIGAMQTLFDVSGFAYLVGGLLFGVALFRARVLARWAAALLALGTIATAALAVLPESFNRPLAVPAGVALIGLGISLWRDQRKTAAAAAAEQVLDLLAADKGLTATAAATVRGERATGVHGSFGGLVPWVAASGTPYPIELSGTSPTSLFTFGDWGEGTAPKAPAGAINPPTSSS